MNMIKVSFYVPCYNAAKYIRHCLDAILSQTYPVEEIVVIDDGSSDDSRLIISGFPVKMIRNPCNKGIAAVRNIALNQLKSEFIASIDADCVIGDDWLARCMSNFKDPNVAAVGGKMAELYTATISDYWRKEHLKHHWGEESVTNPIFLSGSNLVLRRDAITKIGLYDEERYKNNYEDVDLSIRLKRSGFNLIYEPAAEAFHIRTDTPISVLATFHAWKFPAYKKCYLARPFFNLLNTIKLIKDDLYNNNLKLIFMDIMAFIACIYFDIAFLLRRRHERDAVRFNNNSDL